MSRDRPDLVRGRRLLAELGFVDEPTDVVLDDAVAVLLRLDKGEGPGCPFRGPRVTDSTSGAKGGRP